MKKVLALAVLALLAVPAVALAAGRPAGPHGPAVPKVMYILKGKLSLYSPYNAPNNGSITIVVGHSNYHGRALKGQTLTFPLDAKSRVSLATGLTTITDNDRGIVKIRAARKIAAADLATTLQAIAARHVIDQQGS